MKTFSILSLLLAIATALALNYKHDRPRIHASPPHKEFTGVSYPLMKTDHGARCSFWYDIHRGSEFRAELWGSPKIIVAQDHLKYWFWIREYDSKRYYFCDLAELEGVNIIPPLRPSFRRWMLNRESTEPKPFRDGIYTVEINTTHGLVTRQRYIKGEEIEAEVRIMAFQEAGGMKFPALATLDMPSLNLKVLIDMGPAVPNPKGAPSTEPPKNLKGRDLAP